ncbi:HNH endonuclease domain-containing protein (plasmid) [Cyanobacterium sp. IPPAS B-1200]|uniref:HNH endonuclease domain-containing protein n=1 Tax=Cyanobacterium sp. IPPAS B-1200 TaxID=1562720 RepID=UPI00085254CD|nr:HNH endonuclease domain-containing protein [Cyanobacterium sp. IPPAS B-1200]OEJ78176.1 hypothetical protein A5482_13770 [Cyanobacterium sp. IPPAS B-1200]
MFADNKSLPPSYSLNISVLSQLFNSTTNSYKYLFFSALLDILERNLFDCELISFRELVVEMLANAWYPHVFFKLSFGKQDQIATKLDQLNIQSKDEAITRKNILISVINQYNVDDVINSLMRYVPFRLIRPFFAEELQGIKDYSINSNVTKLSTQLFEQKKPLYCFNCENYKLIDSIILHPEWVNYIRENFLIVKGWVAWEWLNYMQKNNSNVPNLARKLFPLVQRKSLAEQAKYWKLIIEKQPIKCIYSNNILDKNSISVDHYLPWSFVAHDQLWNLIPSIHTVNSSKSNNIPSSNYLDKFINLQHQGLVISNKILSQNEWLRYVDCYLNDLKINEPNDLLKLELLTRAYQQTFKPLISLAKIQGFSTNWNYREECG